jgi:hypothetical protein
MSDVKERARALEERLVRSKIGSGSNAMHPNIANTYLEYIINKMVHHDIDLTRCDDHCIIEMDDWEKKHLKQFHSSQLMLISSWVTADFKAIGGIYSKFSVEFCAMDFVSIVLVLD